MSSSSSSDHLPIELVIEILSRLPVKTLIRFTSVCKAWYSLIRNPNFIATHLDRSISNILVLSWTIENCTEKSCFVLWENTFVEHAKLELPPGAEFQHPKIIGSCNGILCLTDFHRSNYRFDVCLWNPSTRKYKTLPFSCFDDHLDEYTITVLGFGFCHRTNDYKVVRILYFEDDDDDDDESPPEVEVYSLSTNSWRRIGATVPLIADDQSMAFVNGAIHWVAAKAGFLGPYDLIMSFDVADEIFGEITLPADCLDRVEPDAYVMAFKGSLSLFVYFCGVEYEGSERCCIWVMRDYGVTESWTKQFTIAPQEQVKRPLGFTKNGQLILDMNNKPVSCDLVYLQFQDLEISGFLYDSDATFMESLVLLEEGNVELGLAD